jgi:hypothetical protein
MLQLLQNLASGETLVADVPAPQVARGTLLIATRASVVSAGTEVIPSRRRGIPAAEARWSPVVSAGAR